MHRLVASKRLPTLLPPFKSASSARFVSHSLPNAPLDLDPDLRSLLKDGEITLVRHKQKLDKPLPRELEELAGSVERVTSLSYADELDDDDDDSLSAASKRKSPAAAFGSDSIGQVVLPDELEESIRILISESDKPQLRGDAKRLFEDNQEDSTWDFEFDGKYKSRAQRDKRGERDGTAFASVALPAHYSAITSVLSHLKHRLGRRWHVSRVVDWGAGAGSGLWACMHAFQHPHKEPISPEEMSASESTITTYTCIEKRDGLTAIAKRLIQNVDFAQPLPVKWLRGIPTDQKLPVSPTGETLALSAFALSAIPTEVGRKKLLKEIWETDADTIILIDHGTAAGFESIAKAREDLLKMGRKAAEEESSPSRVMHVVAPCPHDGKCPLFRSESATKLVCSFRQRLQRPAFTRLTKHSKRGYEDIGYSYVALRRGPRPAASEHKVGRVGGVARRSLAAESLKKNPPRELSLHEGETDALPLDHEADVGIPATPVDTSLQVETAQLEENLIEQLRAEAYHWPRLVFSPLKKGGHVILDGCTSEGHIMRLTIPRSQGKQEYYDARKSSWGDIFPHPPKNSPQIRTLSSRPAKDGAPASKGQDIGKRKVNRDKVDGNSYEKLTENIKEAQKGSRKKLFHQRSARRREFIDED